MSTTNKRMQQRNDTTANWESVNPILLAGEIGYDTTNGQFKIGDGTSAWTALNYYSSGSGSYTEGDGIDISSDVISIDAKVDQFYFDGGVLSIITEGNDGFVTNRVLSEAITAALGVTLAELITI